MADWRLLRKKTQGAISFDWNFCRREVHIRQDGTISNQCQPITRFSNGADDPRFTPARLRLNFFGQVSPVSKTVNQVAKVFRQFDSKPARDGFQFLPCKVHQSGSGFELGGEYIFDDCGISVFSFHILSFRRACHDCGYCVAS